MNHSFTSVDRILDDLAGQGWSLAADIVPQGLVTQLAAETRQLQLQRALVPAGIGRGAEHAVNAEIRSDFIQWIEAEACSPAQAEYLALLENLRLSANAGLQLGLFDFEGHLAVYPPGSFYRKHLDRFRNDSLRTLTCILYLNADWRAGDGGELRVYTNDQCWFDIQPRGGTLFTFLSDRFWHEVLPARRERLSITGWFRTRGGLP